LRNNEILKKYGLLLTLLLIILVINLLFPSYLNGNRYFWNAEKFHTDYLLDYILKYHQENSPFKYRIFVSMLYKNVYSFINEYSISYMVVQFNLLHLCFIQIYNHSQEGIKRLNTITFFLLINILFVFFYPIDTYDDILQYVLLIPSVFLFYKKKITYSNILLACSIFVRESGIILLPGFILLNYLKNNNKISLRRDISFILPVLAFVIFQYFINIENIKDRGLHYIQNFNDLEEAINTIIMFIITVAPISLLTLNFEKCKKIKISFILVLIINTFIIFKFALAKELRLLVLPLLISLPFWGNYLLIMYRELDKKLLFYVSFISILFCLFYDFKYFVSIFPIAIYTFFSLSFTLYLAFYNIKKKSIV